MLLTDKWRLDTLRYLVRTNDSSVQIYKTNLPYEFHKTKQGNLLVIQEEVFNGEPEDRENGKLMKMIIAIRNTRGVWIPASDLESFCIHNSACDLSDEINNYSGDFDVSEITKVIEDVKEKYPIFEF